MSSLTEIHGAHLYIADSATTLTKISKIFSFTGTSLFLNGVGFNLSKP